MRAVPGRGVEPWYGRTRRLRLEPLESRRFLDATASGMITAEPAAAGTPWHNDVYRLDVNNDSVITASDVLSIVNRVLTGGFGDLGVPPGPVTQFYDTNADNRLTASDLLAIVNGILSPPSVQLSTLAPFTADLTPVVFVSATPGNFAQLPNGTPVDVDVDLNNDGDFADPGESSYSQSELYDGQASFPLTTPLDGSSELYELHMQARVKNSDAVVGTSQSVPLEIDTRTSTALADYVNTPDDTYEYHQAALPIPGFETAPYKYFVLDMTSQTWRSSADVNLPVWRHWMEVYVPYNSAGEVADIVDSALLFIRGGSNTSNLPQSPDPDLARIATSTNSVVATLRIVPNEPVIFTDETRTRSEDEIISYTLNKFLEHIGDEGNDTWPLLLPMVKSAVRTMDTVQDFVASLDPNAIVNDFVVSGESKRGWTTWLTAATDDRVRAIMPGVFDNLNQGPQMVNHYATLGFFSEEVVDYTDLDIFERILTPEAQVLSKIVDPYSYLRNGRFDDMPKLILNSAGDEFFVPDSSRFYFDDLPGDQNYLRYIPNTGHGLDARAVSSRATFYDAVLNDRPLPQYSWTVEPDGSIRVQADTQPTQVLLWQKRNVNARDFRNGYNPGTFWFSMPLVDQGGGLYVGNVDVPATGATAYLVELTFPNSVLDADPYVFTTEARIKSPIPRAEWPYDTGTAQPLASEFLAASIPGSLPAVPVPPLIDPTQDAVAVALAIANGESSTVAVAQSDKLTPVPSDLALASRNEHAELLVAEPLDCEQQGDPTADADLVDWLFADSELELLV